MLLSNKSSRGEVKKNENEKEIRDRREKGEDYICVIMQLIKEKKKKEK